MKVTEEKTSDLPKRCRIERLLKGITFCVLVALYSYLIGARAYLPAQFAVSLVLALYLIEIYRKDNYGRY